MVYDENSGKVSLMIKSIGPGDEGKSIMLSKKLIINQNLVVNHAAINSSSFEDLNVPVSTCIKAKSLPSDFVGSKNARDCIEKQPHKESNQQS